MYIQALITHIRNELSKLIDSGWSLTLREDLTRTKWTLLLTYHESNGHWVEDVKPHASSETT